MITIRKAERKKAKLRLALTGVSGSGKTYSALTLATGLGGKIALIDTEKGSGDLYANQFIYDIAPLEGNFSPDHYIKYIKAIEAQGYDILIIDSLSHAWFAEGGVLEIVDKAAASSSSKNSYIAWRNATPKHNALVDAILNCKMHIIATMRSKAAYDMTPGENGKIKPIKIGLAPIQRDGLEYEFTVVLDLSVDGHIAVASKDRTGLFKDNHFLITEETGKQLDLWLNTGVAVEEKPAPVEEDFLFLMSSAGDLDELKNIYARAWKWCSQPGDSSKLRMESLTSFTVAKDKRKKQLESEAKAVELKAKIDNDEWVKDYNKGESIDAVPLQD